MRLSTKPRYGLRILAQIAADDGENKPVCGKTIARKQNLSITYVEQILIPMRNAGLVRTVRGRNGGYLLDRPAEEITLLEIIELFEGRLELVEEHEETPAAEIWHHLSTVLRNETNAVSVADLARLLTEKNPPAPNFTI